MSSDHSITRGHLPHSEELVDIRLIDFAHSTHKGLQDASIHEGPDRGLLFGLDNLASILKEIEDTAGAKAVL